MCANARLEQRRAHNHVGNTEFCIFSAIFFHRISFLSFIFMGFRYFFQVYPIRATPLPNHWLFIDFPLGFTHIMDKKEHFLEIILFNLEKSKPGAAWLILFSRSF